MAGPFRDPPWAAYVTTHTGFLLSCYLRPSLQFYYAMNYAVLRFLLRLQRDIGPIEAAYAHLYPREEYADILMRTLFSTAVLSTINIITSVEVFSTGKQFFELARLIASIALSPAVPTASE